MQDKGFVIYAKQEMLFYTGFNFEKQLRKAKIYHSKKFAQEAIDNFQHKFSKKETCDIDVNQQNFEILTVTISID